jgi:NADPH-dependent curcumin reductase CurA
VGRAVALVHCLSHTETVVDGLDRAPDAFIGLFHGGNTGKMIVRL